MDQNVAAAAAASRAIARKSVERAKCRTCGSVNVAWVKSARTGKWYLADAVAGAPGKVIPAAHKPHFKTCGDSFFHPSA